MKITPNIEILNIRLPSKIVKWLDSLVEKSIYKSRAEAIREFCREYINRFREKGGSIE